MATRLSRSHVATVALAATVLIVDLVVPLGVAGGVPYIVVILAALRVPGRRFTLAMAMLCLALTIVGLAFSPGPGDAEPWKVLANRFLAVFAILATSILGLDRNRAQEKEVQVKSLRASEENLERRVKQRTQQLADAYQELEAFSYSVSHDLRAPLRAVDGFCLALLEDCGDELSEQAQHFLDRIAANSQSMEQLIEATLDFSRHARGDLKITHFDLSTLATQCVTDLRSAEPGREVDVFIEPHLEGDADAELTHVVLQNLIGNAWKFTSECDTARIRFGVQKNGAQRTFFVSDNGVGFDMANRDRLFAPFQRLHDKSRYAGIGIGLATVRRIINRHGGRIWAAGELDRGATFFFTLPPSENGTPL